MIFLSIPAGRTNLAPQTVLVFGVGLIGSSVLAHLKWSTGCKAEQIDWSWTDAGKRQGQADALVQRMRRVSPSGIVSALWSAGAAGFNSPASILDNEFSAFQDALQLMIRLTDNTAYARAAFHLVSSAGGLFEGTRFVGAETIPSGARGYARLKLRQEEEAEAALPSQIGLQIYRPSSVYGFQQGGRINLVSALVRNGYRHETTTIFGRSSTLRDFIHVSDVGQHIGQAIVRADSGRRCAIVASGKPTSMLEVVQTVESVIGQRLLLKFDTRPSNALDSTFRPSVTGSVAARTPLRRGIERTAEAWRQAEFLTQTR